MATGPLCAVLLLVSLYCNTCNAQATRPNIIMIVADDLGYADVGMHNAPMNTPNIEKLKEKGMYLNQSYVMPTCAPTRSALLTGRYPHEFMMQKNQIKGANMAWLNETLKLAPAYFKDLGYDTYAIGKWHLGLCHWGATPTRRGFDKFRGFQSGAQDYYLHRGQNKYSYDFWNNEEPDFESNGTYATELYTTFAQDYFKTHDRSKPFFMYLAHQAVHAPWQVPSYYTEKYCSEVTNATRKIHCGMGAALDESVGNITKTLEEEGLAENTILVFLSDNGGPVYEGSVNWPLRGSKASLWEGGLRSITYLWAPGRLSNPNSVFPYMLHAVDWLATLYEAAGGDPSDVTNKEAGLDGISHWQALRDFTPTNRTWFVLNINDKLKYRGMRDGKYKLLRGSPGRKNGWYPPPELLEDGTEKWEHLGTNAFNKSDWHMYDLEADPYERVNLLENGTTSMTRDQKVAMRRMKSRLRYIMENELDPYVTRPKNYDLRKLEKFYGYTRPGWCDPNNPPTYLPTGEFYPGTDITITRPE